jgi:hypothetical protein
VVLGFGVAYWAGDVVGSLAQRRADRRAAQAGA